MPLERGEIAELAQRFSPYLYLTKGERYLPSSVEDYLNYSELWAGDTLLQPLGTVNSAVLHQYAGHIHENGAVQQDDHYRLKCAQEFHRGADLHMLHEVPSYVHARRPNIRKMHDDKNREMVALVYSYFYPYNGAYNVLGYLMGGHEGDWEHATVHLQKVGTDWTFHSVWYHVHRERDGTLVRAAQLEVQDGTHPVLYVAQNGHGVYPWTGTTARIFGVANDKCSRDFLWRPRAVLLPSTHSIKEAGPGPFSWLLFKGRWGTCWKRRHGSLEETEQPHLVKQPGGAPPGPACQCWWVAEPCRSRHWFKRVFMPGSE